MLSGSSHYSQSLEGFARFQLRKMRRRRQKTPDWVTRSQTEISSGTQYYGSSELWQLRHISGCSSAVTTVTRQAGSRVLPAAWM